MAGAAAADKGLLLPQVPERKDRMDQLDRMVLKHSAILCLDELIKSTRDPDELYWLANARHSVNYCYEVNEAVIARHEGSVPWAEFRLLHRLLSGFSLELSALAAKWPDRPCNAFKAREMNRVLLRLKVMLEPEMGVPLSLVSEAGEHSYSDVSLLLHSYLDVCMDYSHRHFDGRPPEVPLVTGNYEVRLIQDQILAICMDAPKSVLEIGELLGYRDKKTVRKYLQPLLLDGWLARTVPDKPNSRNQKYITARFS